MKLFHALFLGFLSVFYAIPNATAQPLEPNRTPIFIPKRPPRAGTPEQLDKDVRKFIDSLNGGDAFMDAIEKIKGGRLGYFGGNVWHRWWLRQRGKRQLTVDEIQINEIKLFEATVTIKYRSDKEQKDAVIEGPFAMSYGRPLWWERDKNAGFIWQFVPQKPTSKESLLNAPIRWAVWCLFQSPESRKDFQAAESLDNLRTLALGAIHMAQDFDDELVFLPEFQEEALQPYLKNPALWLVPGTTEKFLFNGRLSGRDVDHFAAAARTILFYDGADGKPKFRFDGKAAVGFADGHAELIDTKQFKTLLWE